MNANNPYESSETPAEHSSPPRPLRKTAGTAILIIGLMILAYGATAFWLLNFLPPNGGPTGRLPSLYVIGVGIITAIVGLVVRDLRGGRGSRSTNDARHGIPTSYGIMGIVVVVILLIFVISRL